MLLSFFEYACFAVLPECWTRRMAAHLLICREPLILLLTGSDYYDIQHNVQDTTSLLTLFWWQEMSIINYK